LCVIEHVEALLGESRDGAQWLREVVAEHGEQVAARRVASGEVGVVLGELVAHVGPVDHDAVPLGAAADPTGLGGDDDVTDVPVRAHDASFPVHLRQAEHRRLAGTLELRAVLGVDGVVHQPDVGYRLLGADTCDVRRAWVPALDSPRGAEVGGHRTA